MSSIEGGAEQGERSRRVEAWHKILSSGELIKTQEKVLDVLENKLNSPDLSGELNSFIQDGEIEVRHLEDTPTLSYPNLVTRKSPFLHMWKTGKGETSLIRCASDSDTLSENERMLFETFAFLYEEARGLAELERTEFSPEIQEEYRKHTELASPSKILLDNVQTYLDISRFVTHDAKDLEDQKRIMHRLYTERPEYLAQKPGGNGEINLNPQSETNIELLGRAPFGFWGPSRYDVPVSIEGEPVLNTADEDEPLFSPRFIYMVTRDHIKTLRPEEEATESLMRHGGCPILHKDFKEQHLMQKTGREYLQFYSTVSNLLSRK